VTWREIQHQVKPDPVKVPLCRGLSRMGLLLCCVSNCVQNSVYEFLLAADLMQYFHFTVSNSEVKQPKPAPEPYLLALRKCSLNATEVLAVEDHIRGVASAKAAGVPVVQLCYEKVNLPTIRRFIQERKQ